MCNNMRFADGILVFVMRYTVADRIFCDAFCKLMSQTYNPEMIKLLNLQTDSIPLFQYFRPVMFTETMANLWA